VNLSAKNHPVTNKLEARGTLLDSRHSGVARNLRQGVVLTSLPALSPFPSSPSPSPFPSLSLEVYPLNTASGLGSAVTVSSPSGSGAEL